MESRGVKAVLFFYLASCLLHVHARTIRDVEDSSESSESSEEVTDVVPPTEETEPSKKGDCMYNGTWYKLGDELPTRGSCLMCICRTGFTEPSPLTCAIIDCPFGPSAGCRQVYKEGECCPELVDCPPPPAIPSAEDHDHDHEKNEKEEDALESRIFKTCDCDDRYLAHYEAMKCQPVIVEGCRCPVKFNCPGRFFTGNSTNCVYKDNLYSDGDAINVGNPCKLCECRPTNPLSPISCIGIECPEAFGPPVPLGPGCYLKYEQDSCCSTGKVCPPPPDATSEPAPTCEHNGKVYQLGQSIYPEDRMCATCLCTENWSGPEGPGCRRVQCDIERNLDKLWRGCVPIYHEKTCCPIEYHCPDTHTSIAFPSEVETTSTTSDSTESPEGTDSTCRFAGRNYELGTNLDIKHPTNCVTCHCITPPFLTCIHRACPRPPNDDYENCTAKFERGTCCPEYECNYGAHGDKVSGDDTTLIGPPPVENMCKEKHCNEGEECMLQQMTCETGNPCPLAPVCVKINLNCPTPACAPGCVITIADTDSCPTCSCNVAPPPAETAGNEENTLQNDRPMKTVVEASPEEYPCPMPFCTGYRCQVVDGNDGCPKCRCESPCPPPDCTEPCEPEKDVPEGRCAGCICYVNIVTETVPPPET